MSQTPSNPEAPGPGGAPNPAMVVRRRPASVLLREQGGAGGPGMDAGNRSLADALRVTFFFVKLASLGMVVLFLASGFQTINASERGVRLTFGQVVDDALEPGARWSWPRPLGEILRVSTGASTLRLDSEFMPKLGPGELNKTETELASSSGNDALNPADDGSLLTGDLNIAHARWTVEYVRDGRKIRDVLTNVPAGDVTITAGGAPSSLRAEDALVRAAVMRGAVRAAASVSIDELRKGQPDAARKGMFATLEEQTRQIAQATLDEMKCGLQINSLKLERKFVPIRLINQFNKVEENLSQGRAKAEQAEQERRVILSRAAGDAAGTLLERIDRYDAAYSAGQNDQAEAELAGIDAVMEGRDPAAPRIGGDVASKMSEALQTRASAVSRAQADAELFTAKLRALRSNPSVVLTGDWGEAMGAFLARDTVQMFVVDPGTPMTVWLNRDPLVQKKMEARANEERAKQLQEQNAKDSENAKFKPVVTEGH